MNTCRIIQIKEYTKSSHSAGHHQLKNYFGILALLTQS